MDAVPLVTLVSSSSASNGWKVETNADALAMLAKIDEKIMVLSILGPYRTGKSSLVNWLADHEGFKVGHEVERCTKGVWMSRPIRVETPEGFVAILVLDTEGLGGLADVDGAYDATLFTLTALLSSVVLYNSQGALDERAISQLSLAANLAQNLVSQNHDDQGQWFPHLVWVLRDFALELIDDDGRTITATEYLEKALTSSKTSVFFPERECWTLPQPFADGRMRPEFRQAFGAFRTSLLSPATLPTKLKRIAGAPATGRSFAKLVSEFANVLSSPHGIPELSSAWRRVVLDELNTLLVRANQVHDAELRIEEERREDEEASSFAAEMMTKLARGHVRGCRKGEDILRGDLVMKHAAFEGTLENFRRDCDKRFDEVLTEFRRSFAASTKKRIDDVTTRFLRPALEEGEFQDLGDARQRIQKFATDLVAIPKDDPVKRVIEFTVEASFSAAEVVVEAMATKRDAALGVAEHRAAEAEKQLAYYRGKDLARDDHLEENRRHSHSKTKEALALKTRCALLEGALEAEKEKNRQLERTAEDAQNELQDTARALEAEHNWQIELQERLDLRIRLAKEREEDLAARLARAHSSSSPRRKLSGQYTVLDFLLDDTRDAASKFDVDATELEKFCLDIDLVTILPSLKKLGASSVSDLIFLEPEDLNDFDIDTLQKRRFLDAVTQAKAMYEHHDPLHDGKCSIS